MGEQDSNTLRLKEMFRQSISVTEGQAMANMTSDPSASPNEKLFARIYQKTKTKLLPMVRKLELDDGLEYLLKEVAQRDTTFAPALRTLLQLKAEDREVFERIFMTRYSFGKGYVDPGQILHSILMMLPLAIGKHSSGENLNVPEYYASLAYASGQKHGFPLFSVDRDVAELAASTDLPESFNLEALQDLLGYQTSIVLFPLNVFEHDLDKFDREDLRSVVTDDPMLDEGVHSICAMQLTFNSGEVNVVNLCPRKTANGLLVEGFTLRDCGGGHDTVENMRKWMKEEGRSDFEAHEGMLKALHALILTHYLQRRKEADPRKFPQHGPRPLEKKSVRRPIKLAVELTTHAQRFVGSHRSPDTHYRRGHWRRQRHGPGRKRVKDMWIEPMIVNAQK